MKKAFALLLSFSLMLSLAACGGETTPINSDNSPATSQSEESKNNTTDNAEGATGLDELNETVSKDVENTIDALKAVYEKVVTDIDTYDKYLENTDEIETFYVKVLADTEALCINMREYSVKYADETVA